MTDRKTILIVEDDESIREALKLMLEFEGYQVQTAANGRDGIDKLSQMAPPCMILLDLMMPEMDGWEFAEIMKNDVDRDKIPIVVLTAFTERAKSITNASLVLRKPVEVDLLLQSVKEYCE